MDDYNTDLLAEAKNEYMSRLITILCPLIIEGVKSIFKEAFKLCIENNEKSKYLMTFQNFLSRVIRWNTTIIKEETDRIIKTSGCNYLEDLLTCVHITQLKILTSIRVSTKQKKIDIDIPKLSDFIHKVYILFSRKLYTNIYLFEKDIAPLTHQKNMRECEILCKEAILESIRDSMPIEQILRSYIDETTDEEIIEEISKVETDERVTEPEASEEESKKEQVVENDNEEMVEKPTMTINKKPEEKVEESVSEETETPVVSTPIVKEEVTSPNIKLNITDKVLSNVKEEVENKPPTPKASVDFKDNDAVINYETTKTPLSIKTEVVESVSAPKTPERLEKISYERNEQRKLEEAEEDDDDSDEEDRIRIHDSTPIKLDTLDIHSLDKSLKINSAPLLTDIEVLK
tara:strand:- start:495 stop:1703 length:1209 start_codon:yes stop_codon:yes gene_type:complete